MPYRDADKVVSNVRKWKRANPDKVREQKWRARARKQPHIATLYHLDKSSPIVQQLIEDYVAACRVRWETNQKHQIIATRARRKLRPKQNPGLKLLEPLGRFTPPKSKSPIHNDSVENEVEPYIYRRLEIRREGQRRARERMKVRMDVERVPEEMTVQIDPCRTLNRFSAQLEREVDVDTTYTPSFVSPEDWDAMEANWFPSDEDISLSSIIRASLDLKIKEINPYDIFSSDQWDEMLTKNEWWNVMF